MNNTYTCSDPILVDEEKDYKLAINNCLCALVSSLSTQRRIIKCCLNNKYSMLLYKKCCHGETRFKLDYLIIGEKHYSQVHKVILMPLQFITRISFMQRPIISSSKSRIHTKEPQWERIVNFKTRVQKLIIWMMR